MAGLDAPCFIDGKEYPSPACYNNTQMSAVIDPIIAALGERTRLRGQVERLEQELSSRPEDTGLASELSEMQGRLDEATTKIRSLTDENTTLTTDFQRVNADLIGAENAAKAATGRLRTVQEKLVISESERDALSSQLDELMRGVSELQNEVSKRDIEIVTLRQTIAAARQDTSISSEQVSVLQAQLDNELQRRVDAELKLLERELVVDDLQNRLRTNSNAVDRLRRASRNVEQVMDDVPQPPQRGTTRGVPDDFEQRVDAPKIQRSDDDDEPLPFDFEQEPAATFEAPPVDFTAGGKRNECPANAKAAAEAVMLVGVEFDILKDIQSIRCLHRLLLMARGEHGKDASRIVKETFASSGNEVAYSAIVRGMLDDYRE